MAGRKPIFASLVIDVVTLIRDRFYKIALEPASPAKRRAKRIKKQKPRKGKK